MTKTVTVEFLDRFADAWNRHDIEEIVSMMTPNGIMYASAGPLRHAQGCQCPGAGAVHYRRTPDQAYYAPLPRCVAA
jgi:hypothetical protein